MTRPTYSTKAVAWLVALGTLSFGAFLALLVFGEDWGRASSAGTDAYSRSALGHSAFVAWARRAGFPVLVSRWRSDGRAPADALLVLAEPEVGDEENGRREALEGILRRDGPVLVVLPKRTPVLEDESHPGWLEAAGFTPLSEVALVIDALGTNGPVLEAFRTTSTPTDWRAGSLEATPTLSDAQLLRSSPGLEPVVASPEGVLVGRIARPRGSLWLLSDPDVLANHGLGDGENAVLLARVLGEAVPDGGAIVVDETLHGHSLRPSIARELLGWPLVLAVLQALLATAAILLAATGRHGAPLPAGDGIAPGKRVLIENTADLLHSGGHHAHVLRHYLDGAVQQVLRAAHAPPGLPRPEADEWLARVGRARGVETTVDSLREGVRAVGAAPKEAARAVAEARRIHAWRREMIDGSVVGS